jgi:phage terminase large subunit
MGQRLMEVVIPYCPRPLQRTLHPQLESHRWSVVVCHRRFGKTVMAVNHLQKGTLTCAKPRPRFGYIAPTYRQGKAIAWDYMKHYAAPIHGTDPNESELRINYPNEGQVRIFGADNPDALRGIYLDGVVFDEYGLMAPNIFTEVVRPLLSDRGGWALFIGTPNGKNQFYNVVQQAQREDDWFYAEYKASETGILTAAELADARRVMTQDEYDQEYECSFEASVKGAIYAREIMAARTDGRLTRVPYDPALRVDTDWDLGIGDATAIWFSQTLYSGEVRLIDYYEASGEGLAHYVKVLNQKPYAYGAHWAPHDIEVKELGSGHSRKDAAFSLGLNFQVCPKVEKLEDGIHSARMLFPRCWFDAEKCLQGIEALQHYKWDYNTRIHEFKALPVHDWASHGADAFRGLAFRHYTPKRNPERQAAADVRRAQRDYDPYDRPVSGFQRGGMVRGR